MRVAVFYFSLNDAPDRWPVFAGTEVVGYSRAEVIPGKDLSDALDKGNPRDDESVMNSHEIGDRR